MATHPEFYPQTQCRRGKGGFRNDFGIGIYVRSMWEANWARYLKDRGEILEWHYEPTTFSFDGIERGTRFYTPDFRVTNTDGSVEYHEIKGYMDACSNTKLKRMARYHPEIKLVLIERKQYYAVAETMQRVLPSWEKRR